MKFVPFCWRLSAPKDFSPSLGLTKPPPSIGVAFFVTYNSELFKHGFSRLILSVNICTILVVEQALVPHLSVLYGLMAVSLAPMKKSRILTLLDYLFVLRPTLFFPIWTIALVGAYAAKRYSESWEPLGFWYGFIVFTLYTLTIGAVYLINNIIDRRNDAANNKVFLIADEFIPPHRALVYLSLLLIVITALSIMVSIKLFWWFAAMFLILGVAYSVPPFSLKDRPVGGLLTNVVSGFGLFGFGWYLYAPIDGISVWWHSLPYVIAWVSISMLTTIPDSYGDALDQKETVAVAIGHSKTQDYAFLLLGAALLFSFLTWDWVIGVTGLMALPFYTNMWRKRSVQSTLMAIRWGISFLSFSMFFAFPPYFIACFILFFLARWYYRGRFNIDYPTWKTNSE